MTSWPVAREVERAQRERLQRRLCDYCFLSREPKKPSGRARRDAWRRRLDCDAARARLRPAACESLAVSMPSRRRSPHTGLNVDLHPVRVRLCSRVRDLRSPHASFARAPCARSLSSARFVCALCAYTDAQMAAQVMVGGTGRTRWSSRLCVVARSVGAAAAAGSSYARVRPCASVRAFVCVQVMSAATPPTGTCAPRGAERARQATRARPTDARRAIFVRVSCHVDDWPYHGPSSSAISGVRARGGPFGGPTKKSMAAREMELTPAVFATEPNSGKSVPERGNFARRLCALRPAGARARPSPGHRSTGRQAAL